VFEDLRKQIGLNAKAILKADPDVLLTLATMGGMRPKVRVFLWQEMHESPRASLPATWTKF
jgi:hypothetical protein